MILDFHSTKTLHEVNLLGNAQEDIFMNEERYELAYIAGAFDGDGSFSLIKKIEDKKRAPLYYPLIQFGSKSGESVRYLKNKFGGNVNISKKHKSKEGFMRKEFFRYKLEKRNQCLPFLEKVTPFLKIKKERAELILEYIKDHPFKRGSNLISKDVLLLRERAYQKMRKLNAERKSSASVRKSKISDVDEDVFWPYIAGLMDTDGSFSINKSGYAPTLSLSMVDIKGIVYIKSILKKGNISTISAKTCTYGFTFRWECKKHEDVKYFLTNVIPFLRFKKESAQTLLEFMEKKTLTKHRRSGTPSEELELRDFYCEKLKQLNKYGIYKPSLIDLEVQKPDDRAEGESHRERLNEMA